MNDDTNRTKLAYLESLRAAWESYIKLVDILIGVSGATALVFFNAFKAEDWSKLPHSDLVKYAICFSAVALVCAILWRAVAQHFLEYETIGNERWANEFFTEGRLAGAVTKAHRRQTIRKYYGFAFVVLPWLTSLSIIASWIAVFGTFFGFP